MAEALEAERQYRSVEPDDDSSPTRLCWLEYRTSTTGESDAPLLENRRLGPPTGGADEMRPVKIEGEVVAPKKIALPVALYTEEARLKGVEGEVRIEAVINTEGYVEHIRVLQGLPSGLAERAVYAACQGRFEPATLHGQEIPVIYSLTTRFSLGRR